MPARRVAQGVRAPGSGGGRGLQRPARALPRASAPSSPRGAPANEPQLQGAAAPGVPSVPGSRGSRAFSAACPGSWGRWTRRGHLPRRRKSFQEVCTY